MVKHLENESLEDLVQKGFYIVDFYAEWCGPCKMLGPILEELDENVIKVNTDLHPELATSYGVMSIPTLFFIKDGDIVHQEIGFMNKNELEAIIKKLK